MGFKKMIFGEKMPDKDDPKYKDKWDKDVKAGQSFAKMLRLDKVAACVQRFATNHSKLFLALVFGFVLFSVGLNMYRMTTAVKHRPQPSSAIERQEKELKMKRHHAPQKQKFIEKTEQSSTSEKIEEHETNR